MTSRKLIRWSEHISRVNGKPEHSYTKEYRNGDQATIDRALLGQERSKWNWEYSDSAGSILASGIEDSVLEAKVMADHFNLQFPIDWES